jgi:uncharacterized protein YdhG (YjbR/CyaY superfamily)
VAAPSSVEEYLAGLPDDSRTVLENLRGTIKSVVPEATETIRYQMPAFKFRGRMLVYYAAFKEHCSLFPATAAVVDALGDELRPHISGKGTIRFTPDRPLSPRLVKRIVEARIAENAAVKRR